jgi:hypothetical protein
MLDWWLHNAGAPQPAQFSPDSQKIDYRVEIPPLWAQAEAVTTAWQIKATDRFSPEPYSPLGMPAIKFRMKTKDLHALRDASFSGSTLMLALAVQKNPQQVPNDLLLVAPPDRFSWYGLNLAEYFHRTEWQRHGGTLYIPMQNRLNLATFSLLWSALWVAKFFGMLSSPEILGAPKLLEVIPQVFDKRQSLRLSPTGNWDFLLTDLPRYQPELDPPMFRDVNFRLGLAGALGIIRNRMYETADCLDVVRNYCPESLYGTANLWLFSTAYHHFMSATGEIGAGRHDFVSERLLPLPDYEVRNTSRILLSVLWHVVLRYRALGTSVQLVAKPARDPGEDYSYYGGGIGYFPWITLDNNRVQWMVEMNATRSMADNLDFLNEQAQKGLLSSAQTVADAARLFQVPKLELELPDECPHLFFPAQNIFLRYPTELFLRRRSLISS